MVKKDYYELLGVSKDASNKEIQRAFRRLARKYHPDVNPGDTKGAGKFKEINEAYQTLSDPETRQGYDQNGQGWPPEGFFEEGPGTFTWHFESRPGFGPSVFDDILSSVLQGKGRQPFQRIFESRRPTEIEHPIEVSLEEACHGTNRVIEFMEDGPCPACGEVGGRDLRRCPQCGGVGRVRRPRRLDVTVPAGVKTGSRVRVKPNSQAGDSTGGVGTIVLVVKVRPHQRFQRKEDDLYLEIPVPLLHAILGGEVPVATFNGSVTLKIPPSTQNGRTFRLRGQGMPLLGRAGRGDLYAKVKVMLPTDPTDEEIALFRQLRELTRTEVSNDDVR